MTEKAKTETLAKLLGVAKDLHDHMGDVLAEMDEILGGGVGIGAKLRQVEVAWQTAWSSRYHSEYVFQFAKDRPQWKRLLKTFRPEELQLRMLGYIQDDDAFYVQRRHPLGLFWQAVNKYAPVDGHAFDLVPTVADCRHTPRCASDQQHTTRKIQEMRA